MSEELNRELNKTEGQDVSAEQSFGEEYDAGKNPRTSDEIYTGQEYQTSRKEKEEKKESIGKDISILVMITLVAGALLGVAYGVTKGPIAEAKAQAKAKAQSAVMSMAESFQTLYSSEDDNAQVPDEVAAALENEGIGATKITQIDTALDQDGNVIGYVVTASDPDGYGGDVELMCGISSSGDGTVTIEGISFLSLTETAGMGMRAKDSEFADQFAGKELAEDELIAYTKSGASKENEIDAISGCTITTSAVTDDVNGALIATEILENEGAQVPEKTAPDTEQEASE